MTDLQLMITLIEGVHPRQSRNTPSKMVKLIKEEFEEDISESEILNSYGIVEDFSLINRQINYG